MERKQMPDTPWHVGYTKKKENDPRRHKSRCVYLKEGICHCKYDESFLVKCVGSSHCKHYSEISEEETDEKYAQLELEHAVRDNFAKSRVTYQISKVNYRGAFYYKVYLSEYESVLIPYERGMTRKKILEYIQEYYDRKNRKNNKNNKRK